eukprot:6206456-Pleurochrysis_carterae.AAC.5
MTTLHSGGRCNRLESAHSFGLRQQQRHRFTHSRPYCKRLRRHKVTRGGELYRIALRSLHPQVLPSAIARSCLFSAIHARAWQLKCHTAAWQSQIHADA